METNKNSIYINLEGGKQVTYPNDTYQLVFDGPWLKVVRRGARQKVKHIYSSQVVREAWVA